MNLHKMNTDPVVMVPFVQLIENHPELYDTSCDGYSDRSVVEGIWRDIAEKVGENVFQCKERWKNIRSSYTRWLRSEMNTSCGRRKKPYYLAKHLQFLDSHTKQKANYKDSVIEDILVKAELLQNSNDTFITPDEPNESPETVVKEEDGGDDVARYGDDSGEESNGHSDAEKLSESAKKRYFEAFQQIENKKRKRDHLESFLDDCFSKKQAVTSSSLLPPPEEEHPSSLFFKSIMPDVKKLNDKQSLQLKLIILEKLKEYSEENENVTCKPPS